jgi:hypothetical protein
VLKSFGSFLHFFYQYAVLKNYFVRVLKATFGHYFVPNLTFMGVCLAVLNFVILRKTPELLGVYFDVIVATSNS